MSEPEERMPLRVRGADLLQRGVSLVTGAGRDLRRIDVPCGVLGLGAPPCMVHLRLVRSAHDWVLYGVTQPGRPVDVARWLSPLSPAQVRIDPGLSPRGLRLLFEEPPGLWAGLLGLLPVRFMDLHPAGVASLFVDWDAEVDRFLQGVEGGRVRPAWRGLEEGVLTARQREAMSLAVALGYYEVPHAVDLRLLARRMGSSLGATSELLRRGESAVIHSYFDGLAASRWAGSDEVN